MVNEELAELKSKLYSQDQMLQRLIQNHALLRDDLVKSQKNYADLYDFNSSAYFTIDKHYSIQSVNHQSAVLLKISRKELQTQSFLNFIPLSSQNIFINAMKTLYESHFKQSCEIELLQKGGRRCSVILDSSLIEGELIRLSVLDVTTNQLDINQYLQIEKLFKLTDLLFQHSSDAMVALDNKLYITVLNQPFIELFSMIFATKIEVGMNLRGALTDDLPELKLKILNACKDALQGKKNYVMIESHRNKNEIDYCYEICINSLHAHINTKKEIFLQIKNLTVYKQQEKQYIKQAAIAESKQTNALNEIISALVHEINQPLTAINLYTRSCLNLLGQKKINDVLLMPLEQIARQGEHVGAIIHNLRDLIPRESSYHEETNINVLVKETISILSYEILNSKLKITLCLADNLPLIMANKTHIMQIISNLARNSIEALQGARVTNPELWIETIQVNHYIQVHVRDNGPGIPHALKNKIRNTYFTTKPGGTGLGLRICQMLIEEHDGQLILQNHELGAWFIFTLPITHS